MSGHTTTLKARHCVTGKEFTFRRAVTGGYLVKLNRGSKTRNPTWVYHTPEQFERQYYIIPSDPECVCGVAKSEHLLCGCECFEERK